MISRFFEFVIVGSIGSIAALTIGREYREIQPSPFFYRKKRVNVKLEEEIKFDFPKYEIKFTNSQSPMLIQEIYVTDKDNHKIPVEKAFENFSSASLTLSSLLFDKPPNSCIRWTVVKVPLLTFHPKKDVDTKDDKWFKELMQEMKEWELILNVQYSWFYSLTRRSSIYSISIPPK